MLENNIMHSATRGKAFAGLLNGGISIVLMHAMMLPGITNARVSAGAVSGPGWNGEPVQSAREWAYAGRLHDPYAQTGTGRAARRPAATGGEVPGAVDSAATGPAPHIAVAYSVIAPAQDDDVTYSAAAVAQPQPIDPDEPPAGAVESLRAAIINSLKQNPEIQIALARQDDARFGVHEAWSGYLPHVDMSVGAGREFYDPYNRSGTPSNRTTLTRQEATVTVNQNIWDFGTTINDIKRARAAYKSAQWSTRERIEAISYDISAAYLNVLERQKLVELTEGEIAANEKILSMVTIQEDLGLTSPADVSRAKARLENVQAELLDRKSALQQAREAYRRLTDHLPAKTVDLPPATPALPTTATQAVAMIDDHNPRMAQAVQDRRSIERQRASQTGTFFPRVGLVAQGNWKDNVQGPTDFANDARAMVTVTYSFNGGRDIATRNRLSARLREADYEVDRRRREVEQDIRIDFDALEAAREKISTIDAEIVAAERTADLYRQQFREGRRNVFDLLDSQQILFDARARAVTNGTARLLAEFRVLQQLGSLFDHVSEGEPLPDIVTPAPGT